MWLMRRYLCGAVSMRCGKCRVSGKRPILKEFLLASIKALPHFEHQLMRYSSYTVRRSSDEADYI
jgi:hypothetical protein